MPHEELKSLEWKLKRLEVALTYDPYSHTFWREKNTCMLRIEQLYQKLAQRERSTPVCKETYDLVEEGLPELEADGPCSF